MSNKDTKIDKELLTHLSGLARLNLGEKEGDRILESFKDIVDYFKKLEGLDVEGVDPVGGGNELTNVLREDEIDEDRNLSAKESVAQFPEPGDETDKGGYNKIPPVFN